MSLRRPERTKAPWRDPQGRPGTHDWPGRRSYWTADAGERHYTAERSWDGGGSSTAASGVVFSVIWCNEVGRQGSQHLSKRSRRGRHAEHAAKKRKNKFRLSASTKRIHETITPRPRWGTILLFRRRAGAGLGKRRGRRQAGEEASSGADVKKRDAHSRCSKRDALTRLKRKHIAPRMVNEV